MQLLESFSSISQSVLKKTGLDWYQLLLSALKSEQVPKLKTETKIILTQEISLSKSILTFIINN